MRTRDLPTAICVSLAALLLLLGTARATPPQSGDKVNIREQVKAGRLNKCITDSLTSGGSHPRLAFHNHCDGQVNVSLCVRVAGEPRAYFLILMSGRSDAQQMLWIPDDASFRYKYNSCERLYCTPPEADC
jgi:hypothetical protein